MSDKKLAIFFADGFEDVEAIAVYDILYRAGIDTLKVSIMPDIYVSSSHELTIKCDCLIGDVDFDSLDMLILPGGMPGSTNLRACDKLCDELVRFAGSGKTVGAICAAPYVFAELGLLKGKKATCYPAREGDLLAGGADLVHDKAVIYDNIITSRGMGTAIDFGLKIVEHFLGKDKADEIASSIVYA